MANRDLNIILGLSVKGFEKSLKRAERSLQRSARNMQNIGSDLTQVLTLPIAGIGGAALQAAGDLEALERGLKAVGGEGFDAAAELDKLRKIAELPGLGFEQAVRGSVQLQAVGFNADQARESLAALGRVVATTGGTATELDSVVRQLTQINAKGRLLSEDLVIIQENAPAIGIALQDAFGTTNVEAIRASNSAGEFTAKLITAINESEKFNNVQGGLKNAIENVSIATRIFLSDLGKEINRLFDVQGIAERFASTLSNLSARFRALDDDTKRNIIRIGALVAAIGPALLIIGKLTSVATLAVTGFRALSGVFISLGRAAVILFTSISLPVAAVIAIGAAAVFAYTRFETFRRVVNGVIEVAKELARIAKETLTGIVDGFAALKRGEFAEAGRNFADAIGNVNPLTAGFKNGQRLGEAFNEGFQDESNRIADGLDALKARITGATSGLLPSANGAAGDAFATGSFDNFTGLPGQGATGAGGGGGASGPIRNTFAQDIDFSQIDRLNEKTIEARKNALDWDGTARRLNETLVVQRTELETLGEVVSDNVLNGINRTRDALEELGLKFTEVNSIVVNFGEFSTQAVNQFGNAIAQGASNFADLGKTVARTAIDIIGNLIRVGVTAAISNALKNPAGIIPPLGLALAGAAGAAASGLFRTVISSITAPGLAQGGIIPPGFPNDTFPARLSSGEAVIPLNRLNEFGGGPGVITTRVSGSDLILILERAQKEQNRIV